MSREIYVNLPVDDLARSMSFFRGLGFTFNAEFTNDKAACMVVDERIYVMLLTKPFFAGFTPKAVADAHASTEVLLCLSCASREELDDLVARAVAGGGRAPRPLVDHGFMVQHGFEDPDGHLWELVWMTARPAAADGGNADATP